MPLKTLLQSHLDVFVWSFEAGAVKPDFLIYAESCRALGCSPAEVLMVGDTPAADVDGPREYGMRSILLDRTGRFPGREGIASLSALLALPGA